jgi:hypothetical protein
MGDMKTPVTIAVILLLAGAAFGYTNLGGGVYQSDGSASDTQAAINAATDGQTVQIPNGTYTWSSGVNISGKAITLTGQSAGGVTIQNSAQGTLLSAGEATAGNVVIANLRLVDLSSTPNPSSGLAFQLGIGHTAGGKPVLVHDCYFSGNGNHMVYTVSWGTNGGVIWNCTFDSLFTFATGIEFEYINGIWESPSTMGTADTTGTANTYVEDCTFLNGWIAGMDFADNARTVIRHNTFKDTAIYCHGQDSSPFGPRHYEIYNNTFIYDGSPSPYPLNLQDWVTLRGATGVIFGNTFPDIPGHDVSVLMFIYGLFQSPCYTQYPVPRQIGQTWVGTGGYSYPQLPSDGTGYGTDPLYLWNNNQGSGGTVAAPDQETDGCGNNEQISNFIVLGRDYVMNSKPGYQPYPYPHPLRSSAGPAPTPSPTPTPTPTPTPSPTPTPTPTPAPNPAARFFTPTSSPATPDGGPDSAVEIGVRFTPSVNGTISSILFYKNSNNTGTHTAHLWSSNGTELGSGTFTAETSSGWQQFNFDSPISVVAGQAYVASYFCRNGHYSDDQYFFNVPLSNQYLIAPVAAGVYSYTSESGGAFPVSVWFNSNYWVDVLFNPSQ